MNILEIGNSFGFDSIAQSYSILEACGVNELYQTAVHYPACDVSRHVKHINSNMSPYWVYRKSSSEEEWSESYPEGMLPSLGEKKWDIISFMPGMYDLYDVEEFSSNIDTLYNYVKNNTVGNPDYYWIMPWPIVNEQGNDYPEQEQLLFRILRKQTKEMIMPKGIFKDFIPVGTTVMNLRTTDMASRMTRDTLHMSIPLGRYAAALTYTAKITGKLPSEITYKQNDISDEDAKLVIKAADAAVLNPYEITQL